jgi:hypothetical protein
MKKKGVFKSMIKKLMKCLNSQESFSTNDTNIKAGPI